MADFQDNKITIHPGINDIPIAPTETTGSNISHVHDKHNKLVDKIEATVSGLQQQLDDILPTFQTQIQGINSLIYPDVESSETNFDILGSNIASLQNRITALETSNNNELVTVTEEEFYFDSITVSNGIATIGTIAKSGTITKIQFHDFDNAFLEEFNTYFSNETTRDIFTNDVINTINFDGYTGYEFTFSDAEVMSGEALAIEDTNGNDGYSIEVKVFVLVQETTNALETLTQRINQLENTIAVIQNTLAGDTSEFTFDNISLTNNNGFEEYILAIPKTGTFTKIEFNDVNQLSEIYLQYDGFDLETAADIGGDPNYPYVFNIDPTVSVTSGNNLRIYTEYVEANLNSIRLTIT